MRTFILTISILFASCNGNNDKNKAEIETAIASHNAGYGAKFILDSISRHETIATANLFEGKKRAEEIADSSDREQYKDYNKPYLPNFDPRLTYERFMAFCKEKGHDPLLLAKTLIEK